MEIADLKFVTMQWPRIKPVKICSTFTLCGCHLCFMSLCEIPCPIHMVSVDCWPPGTGTLSAKMMQSLSHRERI